MAIGDESKISADDPKPGRRSQTGSGPTPVQAEGAAAAEQASRQTVHVMEQQSKRLSEGMAKATDFYRQNAEFAANRMNALLSAYSVLAQGAQEIQKTYIEVLQHSFEMATTSPRELMRCTNLSEMADLQQDLLRRGIDEWLEGGSKLLQVSGRVAEEAIRPIQERVRQEAA